MTSAGVPYEEVHFTSGSGSGSQSWNDITNKPSYIVDWTVDQGDTNIDANNIPILPYATNQLASNGTPGLTNYNFNAARKTKLEGIETGAQVNVDPAWTSVTSKPTWLDQLFSSQVPTNKVGSAVGNVIEGRTVAQLRSDYGNLDSLVAAMLKIELVPPSAGGQSFTITTPGQSVNYVEIGSAFGFSSLSFKFDRGTWSNAFDSSANPLDGTAATTIKPYNTGDVAVTGEFGIFTLSTPNENVNNFLPDDITWSVTPSGTFSEHKTYNLNATLLTNSTSTGNVYDAQGAAYLGPTGYSSGQKKKEWRVYKPLFKNGSKIGALPNGGVAQYGPVGSAGNGGESGTAATTRYFSGDLNVVLADYVFPNTVSSTAGDIYDVPFQPTKFEVFIEFGNAGWTEQPSNKWSASSASDSYLGGLTGYYKIAWSGPFSAPVDVRLS